MRWKYTSTPITVEVRLDGISPGLRSHQVWSLSIKQLGTESISSCLQKSLDIRVHSSSLGKPSFKNKFRIALQMLWDFDCCCQILHLINRFILPLPYPSHSWPTLHSPWRTWLSLREWTWECLLWQLSELHNILCLWLDHWRWTLVTISLPHRLLWQRGWVV